MESKEPVGVGRVNSRSSATRVFGGGLRQDQVVGKVTCPRCEEAVAYRVADIGRKVSCPHCECRHVKVGRAFAEHQHGAEPSADDEQDFRFLIPRQQGVLPVGAQVMGAILVLVAALLLLLKLAPLRAIPSLRISENGGLSVRQGAEATEYQRRETSGVPAGEPEITEDRIELLRQMTDLREALAQAQLWQQMLRDFGVPEDDRRLIQLDALIAQLAQQLKQPPPLPPACIAEFRQAMRKLRDAIVAEELPRAREYLQGAQRLRADHERELAPYARSFLMLEQRFRELERRLEGRATIERLLREAADSLDDDRPLDAAEAIAETLFLAAYTQLDEGDFERHRQSVEELRQELAFARGKRAVEDAQRLHAMGDAIVRDEQLLLALTLLPEHTKPDVPRLIQDARELSSRAVSQRRESPLGRQIRLRDIYESALECYGRRGQLTQLVDLVTRAEKLAPEPGDSRDQCNKCVKLLLVALRTEIGELLVLPARDSSVAESLAAVRTSLDAAQQLLPAVAWRDLDQAIREKEQEVASLALQEAQRLADDDLVAAIDRVVPAVVLGAPELRQRAESLQRQWQEAHEQDVRQHAEDALWLSIKEAATNQRWLECQIAILEFERRFSESPRVARLRRIRQAAAKEVRNDIDTLLQQAHAHVRGERWDDLREDVRLLASVVTEQDHLDQLRDLEAAIASLSTRAEEAYRTARQAPYRRMNNYEETLAYATAMAEVLAIDGSHEAAKSELERARGRAIVIADGYLELARQEGRDAKRREYLQRALTLVPYGQRAEEARRMLRELGSAES